VSELYFDGFQHKLTYYTKDGTPVGDGWKANNVVARSIKNLRFLPNRVYTFLDNQSPHRHGSAKDKHGVLVDSVNGAFGAFGIFRLAPFSLNGVSHSGVGVHSGRRNLGGADYITHGCIRTTDDVMQALCYYILNDPLTTLTVINNHDQFNKYPHHDGDSHSPGTSRLA
jgi:hypothetical protein